MRSHRGVIGLKEARRLLLAAHAAGGGLPGTPADIGTAGMRAGMGIPESLAAAQFMADKGWVRMQLHQHQHGGFVTLTAAGLEEVAWLKIPLWWRWTKDPFTVKAVVVAAVTSVITTILSNLVLRWME